ncbi:hypothetical protein G6F70_007003 [Rhizopus microsporus]|nr:hypothetical protein G6F71_002882 [Rhizopus microsporus]KAG1196980.1 hypothetical protein G6F70_007003 [Rhizopus microsporus]KAG1212896.1 hypothetical protein G6F69_003292 [Rhizopus microsporus]KAG1230451.1 hypothetical protein G6F67_006450 [Rhizopus microsporus]KAG1265335.1 hypothetical protein G6F68_003665 [Rhizopus microsporus]
MANRRDNTDEDQMSDHDSIYSNDQDIQSRAVSLSDITTDNVDDILHEQFNRFHPSLPAATLVHNTPYFLSSGDIIKKFGLSQIQFEALYQIIMSNKLVPRRRIALVSLLLPRNNVPEWCVTRIIARIPNNSVKLNKRLLQWIISIYDMIESDNEQYNNLYPVLFHYLTIAGIRTELCHLLYYMTRKNRVTKYRVKKLKEMIDKEKDNIALIALLMVYKSYDDSIEISENVRLRGAIAFEHPDPETKNNLMNIRMLWSNNDETGLYRPPITLGSTSVPRNKRKRNQDPQELKKATIQFRNLDVQEVLRMAEHIDQFKLSEQLDRMLENRILQHVIVCRPDSSLISRMGYWLDQKLLYLVRWANPKDIGKTEFREFLQKLIKLTQFTKAQLPIIEDFLREYLKIWNGYEFQEEVFELVTFLKPNEYQGTEWLKNWALLDWDKHKKLEQDEQAEMDQVTWLFKGLSFDTDYFHSMQQFVLHVDKLCTLGLLQEKDHPLLQHASLSFFELVSSISIQHNIPRIITPAAPFVYRHFFSTSAMAHSRICNIIYQYKMAFEQSEDQLEDHQTEEYLSSFNTCMLNVCNALWKTISIQGEQPPFDLPAVTVERLFERCQERGTDVQRALSITQSAALIGFSKRFMKALEEQETNHQVMHHEPITANSLAKLGQEGGMSLSYQDYRIRYLDHLYEQGFTGIYNLLYSSMKSLINKRKEEVV